MPNLCPVKSILLCLHLSAANSLFRQPQDLDCPDVNKYDSTSFSLPQIHLHFQYPLLFRDFAFSITVHLPNVLFVKSYLHSHSFVPFVNVKAGLIKYLLHFIHWHNQCACLELEVDGTLVLYKTL